MCKRPAGRAFGIIGENLLHTLSPRIHNHLFRELDLDCLYQVFEVKPEGLKQAVEGIRALGIGGVNVTFPHKRKVAAYLDKLDTHARKTGAVNTIKNTGGILVGYNTDVEGLRSTLEQRMKVRLKGKVVMLLGAGGAARACLWVLLQQRPRKILVLNRTPENARAMVASAAVSGRVTTVVIGRLEDIHDMIPVESVDLLINATSARPSSMGKVIAILSGRGLIRHAKALDLNYGKRALSDEHPTDGLEYVDGLYMLCAQAAESFRIWTGIKTDPAKMFRCLTRSTGKR